MTKGYDVSTAWRELDAGLVLASHSRTSLEGHLLFAREKQVQVWRDKAVPTGQSKGPAEDGAWSLVPRVSMDPGRALGDLHDPQKRRLACPGRAHLGLHKRMPFASQAR